MALLGELGAVGLPPQEESAAVEGQAALLGAKGAHAKADCLFIAATEGGDELVQVALVLVPAPDAGGQGQVLQLEQVLAGLQGDGPLHRGGQGRGRQGQRAPVGLGGGDFHLDGEGFLPGVDPHTAQEHRRLIPQAQVPQDAVPVGLGLVGGGGGIDNGVVGPAGVAVVGDELHLAAGLYQARHLEDVGGADGGLLKGGNLLAVYQQAQVAGTAHLEEHPAALGRLPIHHAAEGDGALVGVLAGEAPGDGGAAAFALPGGKALVLAGIGVADVVFIQGAGQRHGVGRALPHSFPAACQCVEHTKTSLGKGQSCALCFPPV